MTVLKWFESIRNPILDAFFSTVTYLGDEICFLAICLTVLWCFSKKQGYYLLSIGGLGTLINQYLKLIFRIPRPWVKDPSFTIVESAREAASGYSFPSGHTQNSVGTFGALTTMTRSVLRWISVALCVLVPVSRLYLGVHTLLDVLVSVVIALLLVFGLRFLFDRLGDDEKKLYWFFCGLTAFALSFLLFVELFPFPHDIDPSNLASGRKNAYTFMGVLVGLLVSYPIEVKHVRFDTKAVWYMQILKVLVGLLIILGIKEGLKPVLTALIGTHPVTVSIRYGLMVVFALAVYPLTFRWFSKLGKK